MYCKNRSDFFSGNANDPFRQQQGVGESCRWLCHISLKICSSSEGSCEAQIKLPKPVLTYVLAQCLINLWFEFQVQGVAHATICLNLNFGRCWKRIQIKIKVFIFHIIVKIRIHHQNRSKTLHTLTNRGIFYPAFLLFACERSFENTWFYCKFCFFFQVADQINFVDFLQIGAAFWKTNYTTFSYLLILINGQNMSEI